MNEQNRRVLTKFMALFGNRNTRRERVYPHIRICIMDIEHALAQLGEQPASVKDTDYHQATTNCLNQALDYARELSEHKDVT